MGRVAPSGELPAGGRRARHDMGADPSHWFRGARGNETKKKKNKLCRHILGRLVLLSAAIIIGRHGKQRGPRKRNAGAAAGAWDEPGLSLTPTDDKKFSRRSRTKAAWPSS